jgi:hypothetical protein
VNLRCCFTWVCLITISALVSTGQENTRIPSTNPELIEGPWETTGASGIDGIFLTIETGSDWQTINIRVYHRDKGRESWGYFATNEKTTTESYKMQDDHSFTLFDGEHLRIHFTEITEIQPFDLDITFSSTSHEWSGTWSHSQQTFHALLKRPEPNTGVMPSVFVGDWTGESTKPYLACGSLHIRQSSDGTLSSWLDRVIASSDRRNGELLRVYSVTASGLLLERRGEIGPSSHYRGILSDDRQVLTGTWTQTGGGELNAPDKFRKLPD